MKKSIRIVLFALLHLAVFFSGVVMASAYNNTGYKWSGPSATYYIQSAFASSFKTAMKSSDATWDSAGSVFRFTYGGTTTRNPNIWSTSYTYDGYSDIGYYYNPASTAVAATSEWGTGSTITEVDTTFNTYWGLTTVGVAGSYDVQSTMTHEFGHWLKLDHVTSSSSPSYCGTTSLATMCKNFYSLGDTYFRTLNTDDKNGIKAIYGT